MKHVLTLLLLIVSSNALATSAQKTNNNFVVLSKENAKENSVVAQTDIKYQPSVNIIPQQGYFNYETLTPVLWQSSVQDIKFSDITIVTNRYLTTSNNSLEQFINEKNTPLNGVNISYSKDNLTLNLALLNNQSLTIPQEKIFIQGSLTVWTLDNFNLSIQGRLTASRSWGTSNNIDQQTMVQNKETQVNKSLSIVGSYLLSDSWAVTGAVMKTDLDQAFKKRISNDKDSDNVALIGTIYSF